MVDYNTEVVLGSFNAEQSCLAFIERLLGDVKHRSRHPMHRDRKIVESGSGLDDIFKEGQGENKSCPGAKAK